jgi:hypothetical protein
MLGALIATVSGAHPTYRASLTVGGLNVLLPPVTGGNQPGVPLDSISVDEQGPGGVSGMSFRYEQPVTSGPPPFSPGDDVQFWDVTNNVPYFGGFVAEFSNRPDFGNQGRSIEVNCVGYESVLDWAVLTADVTYFGRPDVGGPPFAVIFIDAVQSVAANALGTGPLRTFGGPGSANFESTQAGPVSWCFYPDFATGGAIFLQYPVTINAGTTLREAIRMLAAASGQGGFISTPDRMIATVATVDFYYGLRITIDAPNKAWAPEYLTLTETSAENLSHDTDGAQAVRGVFVHGLNAAGTGVMTDGTGRIGRIAYINDQTADTAIKLGQTAGAYLAQFRVDERGTLEIQDAAPTAGVRPGSLLALTDAATGATGTYRVMAIRKTFTGARENWTVTYGGLPPSAANLMRRLTRDTLS